mgnify:CR=1 FL=1
MTFTVGDVYKWSFVISGRPVPIEAKFTGRLFKLNGVEFGRFENVSTQKPYLLSLEGYNKLQMEEQTAVETEWIPA